jgi:gliding motility-associated-like protein
MKRYIFVLNLLFFVGVCQAQQDTVKPLSPCVSSLTVPSVFMANGDGIYDLFAPEFVGEPFTYELNIYNRWGLLMFKSYKFKGEWDGRNNGDPVAAGVYYWTIEWTCEGYQEKNGLNGFVVLTR